MSNALDECRERLYEIYPEDIAKSYREVKSLAYENAISFLVKRSSHVSLFKLYRDPEDNACHIEFDLRGWDYTIEFRTDGSVSMYGVGASPSETIDEVIYPEPNANFLALYDSLVCQMLYVITASQGEYSDRSEWSVSVWENEVEMQKEILRLTREEPGDENDPITYYGSEIPFNPKLS